VALISGKALNNWIIADLIETISHESIHTTLSKNVGIIACIEFDRIAKHIGY